MAKYHLFHVCAKLLLGKGLWNTSKAYGKPRGCSRLSKDPGLRVCKTENLEIKHVDLTFKEDWFKKINPKQLLPALQLDDGSVLTESVDICKYFCDQVGGNYLWPGHF